MVERKPRLRISVFARFLTIMIVLAVTLVLIVATFFVFFLFPGATSLAAHALEQFSRGIAATAPDYSAAVNLARRANVQVRYEGPQGTWSTTARIPSIAAVKSGRAQSYIGREYHLEPAPDGGTYLFAWDYGEHVRGMHAKMLWLLLFLVVGVICTAYVFQRRLLRPVVLLDQGVQSLSKGDLNVSVPIITRDEFGALTDAFNQMVGRVKQMIEARNQLLLDVSHELRSPITRLKVAAALLPDDENKAGIVGDLMEMEAMISELLEMERLRFGHGIRSERQDLVSLLREVTAAYRAGHPGARLSDPGTPILVAIDRERVKTVLRNLLENAYKFALGDSRPVQIRVEQDAASVVVRVADDGPGIPQADLPNVFEPFFRTDRSRSRKTGGYGLGLSICKRIMEAHGGSIAASNNPGRGATFTLTFPRLEDTPSATPQGGEAER